MTQADGIEVAEFSAGNARRDHKDHDLGVNGAEYDEDNSPTVLLSV
jgi:hypothetical protein